MVFTVTSAEFKINVTIISRLKMLWLWITQPRFPCKMENILFFRLFSLYYHSNPTILYFDRTMDLYWCARTTRRQLQPFLLPFVALISVWFLFSLWIVNLTDNVGFFEVPSLSEWRVMHENMVCFWHENSCLIPPYTTSCFSKGWKCSHTLWKCCRALWLALHPAAPSM